jgi:hypothetical protein
MSRFKEGEKALSQNNLVSADYGNHKGLSSVRTYVIADSPSFSSADSITNDNRIVTGVFSIPNNTIFSSDDNTHHIISSKLYKYGESFQEIGTLASGQIYTISPDNSKVVVMGSTTIFYYSIVEEELVLISSISRTSVGLTTQNVREICISDDGFLLVCTKNNNATAYNVTLVNLNTGNRDTYPASISSAANLMSFKIGSNGLAQSGYRVLNYSTFNYGIQIKNISISSVDPISFTNVSSAISLSTFGEFIRSVKFKQGNFLIITQLENGSYYVSSIDSIFEIVASSSSTFIDATFNYDQPSFVYATNNFTIVNSPSPSYENSFDGLSIQRIIYADNNKILLRESNFSLVEYTKPLPSYKICMISGVSGLVQNPTTTGNLPNMALSQDFFRRIINVNTNNPTFLRMSLNFKSNFNRTNRKYTQNGILQKLPLFQESVISNNQKFRIKTDKNVLLYDTDNYKGLLNIQVPANTNQIILETYDINEYRYSRYNQPTLNISNLRVYDYVEPSIGIINNTKPNPENYKYIEMERYSALEVEQEGDSGFYDIVLDSGDKDYFYVSDQYYNINYRPLNRVRNACLEFGYIDWSLVDNDYPVELLVDIVGIDTTYAQDYYDNLGLRDNEVDEFYKNGGKVGVRPLLSTGNFADTIASVHAGANGIYATPYSVNSFKCGLSIYNITQAVINSIESNRSKILVWLFYDKLYERDKFVEFKIGNTNFNKPRIRYKLKNG